MHRTVTAFFLLGALAAAATLAADRPAPSAPLRTQALADMPGKEAVMLTVNYAPGQVTPPHRHNAHTFVYVLEGALVMGVNDDKPVTVAAGETFYESPTDIHSVARNASQTAPAKFLVFFVHDRGAPTMAPAP